MIGNNPVPFAIGTLSAYDGSAVWFAAPVALSLVVVGVLLYRRLRVPRRRRSVPWTAVVLVLVAGCSVGYGGYRFDRELGRDVLLERVDPGPAAGGPTAATWELPVEHPGARHDLLVQLDGGEGRRSARTPPALVQVVLTDATGTVLLERNVWSEVGCGARHGCAWNAVRGSVVPTGPGPLVLTVWLEAPTVESVRIQIRDVAKTDGRRAPGLEGSAGWYLGWLVVVPVVTGLLLAVVVASRHGGGWWRALRARARR